MEFPELFHSLEKSQRTDKNKILIALLVLKADSTPVTSSQIKEMLELHLGKGAPKNFHTSMRRLQGLVSIVKEKSETKWKLLSSGLEVLAKISKLKMNPTRSTYLTDLAIVCALESPEFEAVMRAFGGIVSWTEVSDPSFPHVYREGKVITKKGATLKIVGVTSTSMGLTAAAIVTTQLIMRFKPRLVVMVGIAAGTYDGKKEFGDILVADPSVDYSSGKVSFNKGVREFLPDPYPIGINSRLRSLLQKYKSQNEVFKIIESKWTKNLPGSNLKLFLGPLGAADQVIDDASRILEIQKNWRKLIGVEMETYGVYRACYEAPEPKPRFVSFKSVCDFAAEKGDSWQSYAAFTAAEFLLNFIEREWENLWA